MLVQCDDRLPNDTTLTAIMKGPDLEPSGSALDALANQYVWTGILDPQRVCHLAGLQLGALVPPAVNEPTLGEVVRLYFTEHPQLSEKTKDCYRKCIVQGFREMVNQPIIYLTRKEILQLNLARLQQLTAADPVNKPPRGFWGWQQELRTLRVILRWYAAHSGRDDPWPDKRVLRLSTPTARELPVELQTIEGRRKLIDGLASMRTRCARACRFIAYTGLRRREAAALHKDNLIVDIAIELQSKTRRLRVPLAHQALALIEPDHHGLLFGVTEWQLRKPLIRIFGERSTPHGKKACVTPHDLRRYFKTIGTELGIDPTVMNLLVGHSIKGINKSYVANLRLSVLRAAAQRIADEIDNPNEFSGCDAPSMRSRDASSNLAHIG